MRAGGGTGRKLLALGLVAATLAFIGRTLWVNWRDLAEFQWQIRPVLLVLSVLAHVAVLAWGVYVWSRVLRYFGVRDIAFGPLLRIWSFANAARYVPGVVWQFLAAARLGAASGLAQVVTLSSMIVHVLVSLTSAALVAAFTLPLDALGLSPAATWGVRAIAGVAALVTVHPEVIGFGLRLVPRALHRDVLSWSGGWVDGLFLLGLALTSWILYGFAYFLFLAALGPVPLAALPLAAGVNALSFVAGYLAIPAPGGIGVREAAMTLLLTPLLPVGVAAGVAIAARVWSIVAEIGLAAVAAALDRSASVRVQPPREA
jgi:glycosyltransferase 2 family protein